MKLLEVIINGKPYAWKADDNVSITIDADPEGFDPDTATIKTDHPEHGMLTTVVKLYKADMYTIG